jgi:hypothetical protein
MPPVGSSAFPPQMRRELPVHGAKNGTHGWVHDHPGSQSPGSGIALPSERTGRADPMTDTAAGDSGPIFRLIYYS